MQDLDSHYVLSLTCSFSFFLNNTYPPMIVTIPIMNITLFSLSMPYVTSAVPATQTEILEGILSSLGVMNFRNATTY